MPKASTNKPPRVRRVTSVTAYTTYDGAPTIKAAGYECTVCKHLQRSEIEIALLEGRYGIQTIAESFGLPGHKVRLHWRRCMPTAEARLRGNHRRMMARCSIEGAAENETLLRLLAIESAGWDVYDMAMGKHPALATPEGAKDAKPTPIDFRGANQALSTLVKAAELVGRLQGRFIERKEEKITHGGVVALATPQLAAADRPVLAAPRTAEEVPSQIPEAVVLDVQALEAELGPEIAKKPAKPPILRKKASPAPRRAIPKGGVIPQHPPKSGFSSLLLAKS